MRVVCENCGATYKIPESKLTKEVNKATCRKCSFRMMIRRPAASLAASTTEAAATDDAATQVTANPLERQPDEQELLEAKTRIQKPDADEWSDDVPTQVQANPLGGSTPKAPPPAANNAAKAPSDMLLALVATFGAATGPMLLATNTGDLATQRMLGLFLGLWGALTCLFLLITGNLWRQKGNMPISIALATVLSMGGTAFVEVAMYDGSSSTDTVKTVAPAPTPKAPEIPDQSEEKADTGVPSVADAADIPPPEEAVEDEPPPLEEDPPTLDPEEDLGEPEVDAVPAADARAEAEERKRREMEAAAAKARADREARDAERARNEREASTAPEQSGPPKMKSLPLTVVDTMIRSNMSVKRCFFSEKEANGTLPARVNVRFTVMPTGRVSSARVTTAEYKGSTLDSCLGRSFKAITFPAFEGEPLSMTYPFIL